MKKDTRLAAALSAHALDTLPEPIDQRIAILDALALFLPAPFGEYARDCATALRAAQQHQMVFEEFLKTGEDERRFP